MTAVRATFDGSRVVLPPNVGDHRPGTVIVIFEEPAGPADLLPLAVQQPAFAKVWDNDDDAEYDHL